VTGDRKLLDLRAVEGITIVTARQFLAEIAGP
jgi:predicted nucleic acid-binding protein